MLLVAQHPFLAFRGASFLEHLEVLGASFLEHLEVLGASSHPEHLEDLEVLVVEA